MGEGRSMGWSPDSWRSFEARQQPAYTDACALEVVERELAAYPPLVRFAEIATLKADIADAQAGRAFLVQGGDCAESFAEFSIETIEANARLLFAIADQINAVARIPIILGGRMAGQFAKPRSTETEERDGRTLPAYRGDIVNGIDFSAEARRPDPERMIRAYAQSAATLAHLREQAGLARRQAHVCHEALLLPFEQALVRRDAESGRFLAASAHFLWIGQRTAFPGSAHVEFARGLANPIGIKCGPAMDPDTLLRLLDQLDPDAEPGRITLIARMGHAHAEALLRPLVRAVRATGRPVLWSCDPMHGNTQHAQSGYKTRPLEHILAELDAFFGVLTTEGLHPGGIHLEMTGRDVTECTGGATRLTAADLADRYHTHCDPRLNRDQALELAGLASCLLTAAQRGRRTAA
jgi:3-deoxy-7-phosphoheptulonate synthase